jgi:hypothetical protein
MLRAVLCVLLACHTADAATFIATAKVSPVQKVIQLLDDLKAKIDGEVAAEETLMAEHTKWCDAQSNEREDAITSGERTITDLQASIADANANAEGLGSEKGELASKIAASDQDLSAATAIREQENAAFKKAEAELLETVDTLERAIVVLKRGQTNFLQGKDNALKTLRAALSKVVEASWVDSSERAKVQSLMQAEDTDEDLSLQPQATAAAYESKGGGILDALADLQEKAASALSNARKSEMEAKHAYDMLKASLEQETSHMSKRLSAVTMELSSETETSHTAAGELSGTEADLAADKKYLQELTLSCAAKAKEFDERKKQASEEVGAILKAKEILSAGVKVFLQARVHSNQKEDPAEQARTRVATILRQFSHGAHGFAMAQMATDALADPFAKVRGMIESMVERLLAEAGEEADGKAFCETETEKSRTKQRELSQKADMHQVRIEKAAASKGKLLELVKQLEAEIASIDGGNAEATKLRAEEKAEYTATSAEYKQAADAVANAIQTLQEYYAQAGFVQVAQPSFGGAKSDVASTIIGMLEVAESDFTRLLSEAEASERQSQNAYDTLSQENAVAKAAKQADAKAKRGEIKTLELNLLNYKEDADATGKELDAVMTYLDKLKPQCQSKVMSYADRKAKREQEIAGLKEALAILESAA